VPASKANGREIKGARASANIAKRAVILSLSKGGLCGKLPCNLPFDRLRMTTCGFSDLIRFVISF